MQVNTKQKFKCQQRVVDDFDSTVMDISEGIEIYKNIKLRFLDEIQQLLLSFLLHPF